MADDTPTVTSSSYVSVGELRALLARANVDDAAMVWVDVYDDGYGSWDETPATCIVVELSTAGTPERLLIRLRTAD